MPKQRQQPSDREMQTGKSYAASRNILKDDVAILLAELRSLEGKLESARHLGQGNVSGLMPQVLETFYGLYTQTYEQLKEGDRKKLKNTYESEEEDGVRDFFDDPFVLTEAENPREEGANYKINEAETARRTLQMIRKYRNYLKNAGLTDMKTYETRPGFAYRESL